MKISSTEQELLDLLGKTLDAVLLRSDTERA
jgi:hypothetical protein